MSEHFREQQCCVVLLTLRSVKTSKVHFQGVHSDEAVRGGPNPPSQVLRPCWPEVVQERQEDVFLHPDGIPYFLILLYSVPLSIPSTRAALNRSLPRVRRLAARCGCTEERLTDLEIAVVEALANAMTHGNLSRPKSRIFLRCYGGPGLGVLVAVRDQGQGFDPDSVPDRLEVSVRSADGEIMGLRHRELSVEAVQFHPESVLSEAGHRLLENFLQAGR